MTSAAATTASVHTRWRRLRQSYAPGEDRPLGGYAAALGAYGAGVLALAALARRSGRSAPAQVTPWDVTLVAVATHKISRLLTKAPVTSPIRAPFTGYDGAQGNAELREHVRGSGLRHTVGELLTCPFCLSQWIATSFAAGLVFAPRETRLAAATFTAVTGSDWLQYAHARLQQTA